MINTISLHEFLSAYGRFSKDLPKYRLGQHFVNYFLESCDLTHQMWGLDGKEAAKAISDVIRDYQWDTEALVIVNPKILKYMNS